MDPARIIAVLGSHDTIVPYAYGMDMAARWRLPPGNTVVWKTGHIGVLTDMLRTPQGAELFARAVGLAKDQFTSRAGRRDSA
jgi:hypothetical protein